MRRTALLALCLFLPGVVACSDGRSVGGTVGGDGEFALASAAEESPSGEHAPAATYPVSIPADQTADQGATVFDWPSWRGPHANGKSSETELIR